MGPASPPGEMLLEEFLKPQGRFKHLFKEGNEEVLEQLGFSAGEIDALHASGAVPKAKERAVAAVG